jgi:protease-4
MPDSVNNHIAVLTYLKDKVHKWRNIAALLAISSFLLLIKLTFGEDSALPAVNEDYIASVKIEGVISEDDYRSEILEKLVDEKLAKAVIVEINSPGGGIVGSEILFENLRKIAAKKPLVVTMGSVAASGGYMAAIAADYIIARNGTLTGSIGVLMESPNLSELADKFGVKVKTYKSSPFKGSPSLFERQNPAVDAVIQDSIADSFEFFAGLVRERRKDRLDKNNQARIFDGRVFTGRQALKAGLIDEIGGRERALSYLKRTYKIDPERILVKNIVIARSKESFVDKLMGFLPFYHSSKLFERNHQIMAVMPY